MPNRVIREGMLDSQRYWSVTIEARQLFVHLMLLADDFGLVSLAPVFIRRRCFDDAPAQSRIDKLIEQLHDADLIRVYSAGDAQARYAFIPRFGQRLRLMRCKHPMPPEALFADDDDVRKLFNENKHKFKKASDTRQSYAGHPPGTRRPEVESKKGKEVESKTATAAASGDWRLWAKERGVECQLGESDLDFQVRVAKDRLQTTKDGAQ